MNVLPMWRVLAVAVEGISLKKRKNPGNTGHL